MSTYLDIYSLKKTDLPGNKVIVYNEITDIPCELDQSLFTECLSLRNSFEARCIFGGLVRKLNWEKTGYTNLTCLISDSVFFQKSALIKALDFSKEHEGWEDSESDKESKKLLEDKLTELIETFDFDNNYLFISIC